MAFIADQVAGFEEASVLAQIDQHWKRFSTDTTTLIGSGHSLAPATDSGVELVLPSGAGILCHTITSDASVPYTCFAMRKTASGSRAILYNNYSGLGIGMHIVWKSDGTFEIFDRTGTSKGVTNSAYATLGQRYYLQISNSAASSSETLHVYVDGVLDKDFTGDWRGGGINTAGLTEWNFCYDGSSATTGAEVCLDDVYLLHETGGFTSLTFPNLKVEVLPPDEDGSTLELTPSSGSIHYAMVDQTPPETANWLESLPKTGAATRTDLFGYPAPSTDDVTKKVYAVNGNPYIFGSVGVDDRIALRTNFPANASETQTVSNVNGNGSLPSTSVLYRCPVAMPINVLSSGGGGVTISSFETNYTFGPRIVRGGTVATNSSFLYTWSISIAKEYFVAATNRWYMGTLGFPRH